MSYAKITNPVTNRKVNISSKLGIKILNNYLNQLGGSEKQDLVSCSSKIGKHLGSGGFKEIYVTNCDNKLWKDESVGFKPEFTDENCAGSIIAIMGDDVETFENENKIQNITGSPKMWSYGRCKDMNKLYKIEERLDMDLFDWVIKNNFNISIYTGFGLVNNFKEKFIEIIDQVKFLHDKGYGHFDIKTSNIMVKLSENNTNIENLRLIDYGLSRPIPDRSYGGTHGYYDTITMPKNDKTDVFALGMTLYMCLFGTNVIFDQSDILPKGIKIDTLPLPYETPIEWISRTNKKSKYKSDISLFKKYPILNHLLYKMFLISPKSKKQYHSRDRYGLDEVLDHSFWKISIDDELNEWPNTPEYQEMETLLENRRKNIERFKAAKQEEKRDIRNKHRAVYGSSKRGSNCVCIGPCEHQTIPACIAGMCMNTKKCPVDPNNCGGKKFDKC
jgi:serine/threonine protein kinase